MSDQRDRDDNLAGPLRAALEGAMHSPAGDCPDPETLAAYFDRTLNIDQQATCDHHLSTCSRCQALLAAVVRSEEPAGAPQHEGAWVGLFRWRWLVPATATATALAVWLVVDGPGSERSVEIVGRDTVVNSAPAGQGATGEARPAERSEKDVEPPVPPRAGGGATPEQQSTAAMRRRASSPRADSSAPVGVRAMPADAARESNEGSAQAPAPAPPRPEESVSVAPPPPSATAVPAAATPESRREYSVDPLAKSASTPAIDQAAANARGGFVEIRSPAPRVRWRIGPFGIQRSNDAGASWSNQRSEPNTLTAGASPSALVCWAVGADGTVLRTVDGTTWERLPAPTPADLIAIVASSQNEATVTAQGGQQYVTVDGGRTWRAR